MEHGKFSSKGQLVVPKDLRESLNVKPGTPVRFERINARSFKVELVSKADRSLHLARAYGMLKRTRRGKALSVAEMDEAVLKAVREDDERTQSYR